MKGAIAEPWVNTIKPPKITIMVRIGSSQYFFRTLRNRQNSARNDNIAPSELIPHRFRRRPARLPLDPIASRGGIAAQSQRVATEATQDEPGRNHRGPVEDRHDHGRDNCVQEQAEPRPESIERRKQAWPEQRASETSCADAEHT